MFSDKILSKLTPPKIYNTETINVLEKKHTNKNINLSTTANPKQYSQQIKNPSPLRRATSFFSLCCVLAWLLPYTRRWRQRGIWQLILYKLTCNCEYDDKCPRGVTGKKGPIKCMCTCTQLMSRAAFGILGVEFGDIVVLIFCLL